MSNATGANIGTAGPERTLLARLRDFAFGRSSLLAAMPLVAGLGASVVLLGARYLLAAPFFKSGLTKWKGFLEIAPGASYLFDPECNFDGCYKLQIFGEAYAFPFPTIAVHLAGAAEIVLPVLVMAGFLTRFAALGLLGMTVVIQLVFWDGWPLHIYWAGYALVLIVLGPGLISLDEGVRRWVVRSE